jgi:hypothetical protein
MGYLMLVALGVTLGMILIGAAIHSELRRAWYGLTLSNGVQVLVSPATYRAILARYRALDEPEAWRRWDDAILDVLRPQRPHEWRYLARSLGYHVSEGFGPRKPRQTVRR